MSEIFDKIIFGNSLLAYLLCAGSILAGMAGLWVLKVIIIKALIKWTEKTETKIDDFVILSIQKYLLPLLYYALTFSAVSLLHVHSLVTKGLSVLGAVVLTVVGILFVRDLVFFIIFDVYLKKHPAGEDLSNRFRAMMPALSVLIWVGGFIFLLDNLGFKISTIITGLGIGGVAVALAASTILGELFSYFSIMLDRPFVIGDFVVIGEFMGTVEKIGIKSTWLRSLGGERLIFSNKDLTDSRIRNFKKMEQRRALFKIGVTYDTPIEKLKEIPDTLKKIIQKIPGTVFDRAHFASFADFSLGFEVVYYVLSSDYNKYMDIQQAINFSIAEEFSKRKIEFALPTQTLHVESFPANGNKTEILGAKQS